MTTYNKYTWVCTGDCDALIEYTYKDGFGWPNGVMQLTCPCNSTCTLLSVVDATITPSTETKGNEMETTETTTPAVTVPDTYNSNLLVTYKVIRGYSDAEYATDKVASIEWDLHNGRQSQKTVHVLNSKIDTVKDIIGEAYADSDDQETLRSIAEALSIDLTRTVEWSATIEVSGTIELDLLADSDTDVEQEIYDSLYVDSQNGNIQVDDTEVTNVREN
jgi:neutral trehalase